MAETVYPVAQRNDDQNRILLCAYTRGLANPKIARAVVVRGRPGTLHDAMTLAMQYAAGEDAYCRLGRNDGHDSRNVEPMEVAFNDPTRQYKPKLGRIEETDSVDAKLKILSSTMEKLHSKIEKLTIKDKQTSRRPDVTRSKSNTRRPFREQRNNFGSETFRWDKEGKPICVYCDKSGHIARECYSKQRDISSGRQKYQQGN